MKTNPRFDLSGENPKDLLLAQMSGVIVKAKKQPKDAAFDFFLRQLPDSVLNAVLEGINPNRGADEDHPSHTVVVLAGVFLRSHLHGDKKGGFSATDDEFLDVINTIHPYFIIEFARRRQCFGFFEMPNSPWIYNAVIRVREPNRENLERTVAELKSLNLPYPPLLDNEELLKKMEDEDIGIELPMPARGIPVATEQMLRVRPDKLTSLEPLKFIEAYKEVMEVISIPKPILGFDVPDIDFHKKDGRVERLNGEDSPVTRAIQVFGEHYEPNFDEAQSALARFMALQGVLEKNVGAKWVQEHPDGLSIHPAVLVAAATVKLTKGGFFPPSRFAQEVEELIKESEANS